MIEAGTGLRTHELLADALCTPKTSCPSDLGCGNLRAWCEIKAPYRSNEFAGSSTFELHFVDAATLADGELDGRRGVDVWVEYWEALNANMTRFNAFMHNKVTLWASGSSLGAYVASLARNAKPTLRRRSTDADGVAIAHVGFEIGGRVFEIAGRLSDLDGGDALAPWGADECPAAHALPATAAALDALASESDDDFAMEVKASSSSSAASTSATPALMFVMFGATSADAVAKVAGASPLARHLANFSGASVAASLRSDACDVVEISWPRGAMSAVAARYVTNRAAPVGARSLADLDEYVARDHDTYTKTASGAWYAWDHWLDQHVGLWYGGAADGCAARASAIRAALEADGVPVGERSEPDAHEMYSGYDGPMTWEWQFENCDAGAPDAPSECACVPSNNDQVWMEQSGGGCVEQADDWCS